MAVLDVQTQARALMGVNVVCPRHRDTHKRPTHASDQSFPISKLGGCKHTIAFHKSSESNKQQTLKLDTKFWCYENQSVIGNR